MSILPTASAGRIGRVLHVIAPVRPGEGVTALLLATNVFVLDTLFFRMGDVVAGLGVVFVVVEVLDLGVHTLAAINLVLALGWLWLAARAGRLHDVRAAQRAARAALGIRETAP